MDAPTQSRWFHVTPGRFVVGLLAVEGLLWLSDRFGWLGWHKGYAVLTGVACVGVAMVLMLVWFGVAVVFRRRFQFSLRSLLVLVVVVAVPCSWLAMEMRAARRQKEAVAEITKWQGIVLYDDLFDSSGVPIQTAKSRGPRWLRNLLGDDLFIGVFVVLLDGPEVTDARLECLKSLPGLQGLALPKTQVTDAGLERLGGLNRLRQLRLGGTQITDAGLEYLHDLNQLRGLDLGGTKVTNAGLVHLEGLNELQVLMLEGTHVTSEGVAKLQRALPNCKITR